MTPTSDSTLTELGVSWHEGDVRFDLPLLVDMPRVMGVIAYSVTMCSPESPGRRRALERLGQGDTGLAELICRRLQRG